MTRDNAIALKIINKAMQNVKSQLEPLTYAVNIMKPQPVEDDIERVMTDSENIYFNARQVIRLYERGEVKYLEYQIIHIALHGILGHFSDTEYMAKKLAWRVMDLEVEQILDEIQIKNPMSCTRPNNYQTIGMSLYHHALRDTVLRKRVLNIGAKRQIDDHELWWNRNKNKSHTACGEGAEGTGNGNGTGENSSSGENMIADKWNKAREYLLGNESELSENSFKNISDKLKKNKGYGSESSGECKCVKADAKQYSFHEVFKEFLQSKSVSKDQPDFHDPMLYQYGLDMYGNIPILEPLEEIEGIQLSNLVIAIDTSGSCEDYIQMFLAQIISIFKEISTRFHFEKIYLMQCDASIKNVCEFSEIAELEEVNETMKMYGFGGTSFTPVFRWIERNLTDKGDQVDCLLYLSDGEGSFPTKAPDYPVFFIIPEEIPDDVGYIPKWIRKVSIH